jgi:hypothetical protein
VGEAEAQVRCREEADANKHRKTQADEFCGAKEALDAYEGKAGREEKGGLITGA